ncbi:carcinoembryonic antigen-related cell adhesion molecule 2-like [Microtus ochrogaster]|uniref:Carcinoembryonic antigen-related cell adhesion molecule 2-like n=1 Tax=Microtus ochrogaster TaxID=79684 RepID=A0ABM1UJ79_MICOH|nr:carcinoembryonic antigen-related cell adhesion molecule 2-like [Microtus ochrogaster]
MGESQCFFTPHPVQGTPGAESSEPRASVCAWVKNISCTSNGTTAVEYQDTIEFRFTREVNGTYVCEIKNLVSSHRSQELKLKIIYGPDVPIISPSNTYFRSRTNLSLSCHSAALPPALYSWFVNGELVSSSQELFIPNITTNNSGSYTCFVYNSVTGLNKTTVKNNITALENSFPTDGDQQFRALLPELFSCLGVTG